MTTPGHQSFARRVAAERRLVRLVDEAMGLDADTEPLDWLLERLPVEQHSRASRLLLAAQSLSDDGVPTL